MAGRRASGSINRFFNVLREFPLQSYVSVSFRNQAPVRIDLHAQPTMEREAARQWLEQQFVALSFAQAAVAVLGKATVNVDADSLTITY